MLKKKLENQRKNSVKKKVMQNKKSSFPKYKFCFVILFILLGILSLILIPGHVKIESLYGILLFYVFFIISFIIIFTDKSIISKIKLLFEYIKNSTRELSKIVWPDRKTAMTMSIMVIIFVTILSLFIWGVDTLVSWLFYDIFLRR